MNIAIDFKAWSLDFELFFRFCELSKRKGHRIYCLADDAEQDQTELERVLQEYPDEIICLPYGEKKVVTDDLSVHIDVWIGDQPETIGEYNDS